MVVDPFTDAEVVLQGDHSYIHRGYAFVYCGTISTLAAGSSSVVGFKTPPKINGGKIIHFRPADFAADANSVSMTMSQNAAITSGTMVTPVNCNRISTRKALSEVKTGVTVATAANEGDIYLMSVGSGGASNRAGGGSGADNERVLKPDCQYTITFTNTGSSTATNIYYTLFWYEESVG